VRADWLKARLEDCCKIIGGSTPSTSINTYWDGDICWATPKDLSELEDSYISDTPRKITRAGLDSCAATILPIGSVLFSSRAPIGHVAVNTVPMATNQGFKSFLPKPGCIDAKFLYWWLRTNRAYLESLGNGATFKEVSKTVVAQIEILLPPLSEQQRIAEILDKAEALRSKRRSALAQLDTLTKAIFLDLFGDPKLNVYNWPICRIGSVIANMHGGANLEPDDFIEAGFPILHKGAIKPNGEILLDVKKKTFAPYEYALANRRCQVDRKFIAVTLRDLVPTGPSIGLVANLKDGPFDEYLLAQGTYGFLLELDKIIPEYFVFLSNMPNFRNVLRKYAVGSTQIHIRTPVYLDIPIPLPPLQLQHEFACRVNLVNRIKAMQQRSLIDLDTFFASLQYLAFKGELG